MEKFNKKIMLLLMPLLLVGCNNTSASNSTSKDNSSSNSPISSSPSVSDSVSTVTPPSTSIDDSEQMDTKDILNNLSNSPFSTKMKTKENLGLSNISEVGIDQNRFENEVLYEVPTEGTIYNAEDIGITPDALNNSGTLSLFINSIKNNEGNKIIKFKKNTTYPFSAKVDATSIENLYLVGDEGTTFLYSGWGTYFEAKASKNVHINNISLDMKYSPAIAGEIKSFEEKSGETIVKLSISDEFDLTQAIYNNWQGKYGSYMECYYDENAKAYVPNTNANLVYNTPTSSTNNRYKGILGLSYDEISHELSVRINQNFVWSSYKTPVVGTMVSLAYTMYDNFGFYFQDCDNVYLEHVNIYVAGGMGLRADRGKNLYLNHVNYAPKPGSKRIMTCTADIIHTIGVENDLIITNSTLSGSHDDALNIKSFYLKVSSVDASAREIVASQTQNECTINNYEVGDKIVIYDTNNMEEIDTFTITDIIKAGTTFTITVNKRPSKKIVEGLCIGNDTKATRMKLNNCLIQNKRNRGILLQTRYSEITNCTFRNVVMGAIQVLAVNDSFKEAIVPSDIKIENNKFLTNRGGDLSVFAYGNSTSNCVTNTIKNIDIKNNYFFNGSGTPLWLLANGNTNVINNLFYYSKRTTALIMNIRTSNDVTVQNNVFYTSLDIATIEISNDCTNVTNKDNELKGA